MPKCRKCLYFPEYKVTLKICGKEELALKGKSKNLIRFIHSIHQLSGAPEFTKAKDKYYLAGMEVQSALYTRKVQVRERWGFCQAIFFFLTLFSVFLALYFFAKK